MSEIAPLAPASSLPPAQPNYIFRGHASAIHALRFFRANSLLISGDADGWIVVWSIAIKRPVAVWRAHEASILSVEGWEEDKLITHGRDGKICVWAFSKSEEGNFSTQLPAEDTTSHRRSPWLLHVLPVSSVNFCAFASSPAPVPDASALQTTVQPMGSNQTTKDSHGSPAGDDERPSQLLIAVPSSTVSQVDVYALPSAKLVAQIPSPPTGSKVQSGMVMALRLFMSSPSAERANGTLTLIVGYENGHAYAFRCTPTLSQSKWEVIYASATPHSQPVLSLDVSPLRDVFFTSSADATILRHPLVSAAKAKQVPTGHAGQQGLTVRSDGKVFATAGWDARARVYSAKTCKELAVLKWHKEGVYAVAFAEIISAALQDQGNQESEALALSHSTLSVRQKRERKAQETHWVAAGAKDGKISLWDIY